MPLNFPNSPVDKQVYVYPSTGAQYVYDAANTRWTTNTFISNVVSGYYSAVYDSTNNAYTEANSVYAAINVAYAAVNVSYNTVNAAYTMANADYVVTNSAYALANTTNAYSYGIANGTVTINNISLSGSINPGTVNVASQTLTDGATINWNIAQGPVASVTLGDNRTIAAPTNLKVGTFILHVYQDGTGGRTLTWNSIFKWPAAITPSLTATPNAHDMFSFVCDGTNLYGSYLPDVR
jgi:hypothetical protein